jgi:hypothetical protein
MIDSLLKLMPTFEVLECPYEEIVAARDFTGVPYHIYTTTHAIRFDFDAIRYMVDSRGKISGRRSFIGSDGRLIASDVYERTEPHTIFRKNADGLFESRYVS